MQKSHDEATISLRTVEAHKGKVFGNLTGTAKPLVCSAGRGWGDPEGGPRVCVCVCARTCVYWQLSAALAEEICWKVVGGWVNYWQLCVHIFV